MAQPYAYPMKQILLDVTVTALTAGAIHTTAVTGTLTDNSGTSAITQTGSLLSINSTALASLFGDATDLIIYPPVAAAGTFPDVQLWPYVDGIDIGDKQVFDGSAPGNMMPNPANTIGQRHVALGIAYREAVLNGMKNLPLKVTGLKAIRQYQFRVQSSAGWTTTDQPLRIVLLGDKLDAAAVAAIAQQGYQGAFSHRVAGFQGLQNQVHTLAGGPLNVNNWTSLPGGNSQGAMKIFRFFRNAYNAAATSASGQFILSNQNSVQGAQGNVAGDNYDLGFDYSSNGKYLAITEAGIRAGANSGYWGVKVEDTYLPDGRGIIVTQNANPWAYGNVQPQRASSNEYFALPRSPFPVVAYQNKLAFFLQANGTAESANATSVAVGGIQVEGV